MEKIEANKRDTALLEALTGVWEASVKATHAFLPSTEIASIKAFVPQALEQVEHLIVLRDKTGRPAGFMGIQGRRLEMLFLSPEVRGKGFGKALLQYGIDHWGVSELTVNKQNPQAIGFYQRMGFTTYKETPTDEEGRPYPLLYMKREG